VLPTLVDLCGLDAGGAEFDGVSLAGLLRDEQYKLPDRKLVVQYGPSGAPWNRTAVMWDKWRMIGPEELYDLRSDPGQRRNVAADHPQVNQAMADHYKQWHAEAISHFEMPRYVTLGAEGEESTTLYANDWTGGYCDNSQGLYRANANGYWNVIVERDGDYTFELRRWPFEAGLPMAGGDRKDGGRGARPIAKARLKIGEVERTVKVAPGDKAATFTVSLRAGKTRLETFLTNDQGKTLCGAAYVRVKAEPSAVDAHPVDAKPNVPFIIVAPGVTKPGSVCDEPVTLLNIYRTLVELCGLPPKADNDGHSLVPLLRNPDADWPHPAIMTQGRGNHALRTDRWRYIRCRDGGEELYDHEHHPWEWRNLAGEEEHAEVVGGLRPKLDAALCRNETRRSTP